MALTLKTVVFVGLLTWPLLALAAQQEWSAETTGAFRASQGTAFLTELETATRCLELAYPGRTTSQPGEYGAWQTTLQLPADKTTLSFYYGDSFPGPTKGYHVLQMALDDEVIWEADVAGGSAALSKATVELPERAGAARLSFRVLEKATVTNFPIRARLAVVSLQTEGGTVPLLPVQSPPGSAQAMPPDLPLPSLPPSGGWSWQANIVQPWGKTQTIAVREAEEWSRRFVHDYGLNAIIMLPPAAHNAITAPSHHITEEQFQAALTAYRREGMKVILYTSIMHKGHDPEWQRGELAQTRPEWAMRDAHGNTVVIYGQPWLCPATGALEYTLEYTAGLVRRYNADGVMLDNNEFMVTDSGLPTCYCPSCRAAFRRYILDRFTPESLQRTLGLSPDQVRLPEGEEEPLWGLWLAWRNRLWAQACERFRARLRQDKPDLVVSANTQYLYRSWTLAVDGQYEHLDAFLSESRVLQGPGMAAKMLLGRALAVGRPLWNYIGTFNEKDFTLLRPAEEVAAVCAASEAYGANPWIVFYGFQGEANRAALEIIQLYTDFWRDNAELLGASQLRGDVAWLFSTESRDFGDETLLPPLVADLIQEGIALGSFRDRAGLSIRGWEGLRAIVATHSPCLRQSTAEALAAWVKTGGRLITTPATGWQDECGRWRSRAALSQVLGKNVGTAGTHTWGRGEIVCVATDDEARRVITRQVQPRVKGGKGLGICWSVSGRGDNVLAVTGFEGPIGEMTVHLPQDTREVELRTPGEVPRKLPVSGPPDHRTLTCQVPGRLALLVCVK